MTDFIRAKIKDRAQFQQVFPLPVDGTNTPDIAKFILSIIGMTIHVRKMRSNTGSFYYVSEIDSRFVIMPSWIEYFDTVELVPTHYAFGSCVEPLVLENGSVIVTGL